MVRWNECYTVHRAYSKIDWVAFCMMMHTDDGVFQTFFFFNCIRWRRNPFFLAGKCLNFSWFTYSTFSVHFMFYLLCSTIFEIKITIVEWDCIWNDTQKRCDIRNARVRLRAGMRTRLNIPITVVARLFRVEWIKSNENNSDYLMKRLALNDCVHYLIANGYINSSTTKTMCENHIHTQTHKHTRHANRNL